MNLKKDMTVGDILDYSIDIFKSHYKKYFQLVLIFHVPVTFFISFLMGDLSIFISEIIHVENEFEILMDLLLYQLGTSLYSIYSIIFINVLSVSAIKMSYDFIIYNRTDTVKKLIKYAFNKFGWLFLAQLIQSAVLGVASFVLYFIIIVMLMITSFSIISIIFCSLLVIAFLVAAVYFAVRLSLTGASVSIDGTSVIKAFKASYKLTQGKFCKTLFTLFFSTILLYVVSQVFSSAISLIPFSSKIVKRLLFAATKGCQLCFCLLADW